MAATPFPLRRTGSRTQLHDTPTPAPSSHHSSFHKDLPPMTSLKPRPLSTTAAPRAPLGSYNFQRDSQPHKPSLLSHTNNRFKNELEDLGLSLDVERELSHLNNVLDIGTDHTERERRTLEAEINQGLGELRLSPSPPPPPEPIVQERDNFRARIEDPSDSGSESLGDDFSLRIGLAGRRVDAAPIPQAPAEESLELTYTTVLSPPRAAPAPQAKAPSPPLSGAALRNLGKEFERARPRVSAQTFAASPPVVSFARDETRPLPPAGPTFGSVRSTIVQPTRQRSRTQSSGRLDFSAPPPVQQQQQFQGDVSLASTLHPRVPDVTGLTFGLQSPVAKVRTAEGERDVRYYGIPSVGGGILKAPTSAPRPTRTPAQTPNAVEAHLTDLRTRLSLLEVENRASAQRVRDLEREKAKDADAAERMRHDERYAREREDGWEERLRQEGVKREALEILVTRLKGQIGHLSSNLSAYPPYATLNREFTSLRSALDDLAGEVERVGGEVDGLVKERRWEKKEHERQKALREAEKEREREEGEKTPRAGRDGWKSLQELREQDAARVTSPTPRLERRTRIVQPEQIERKTFRHAFDQAATAPVPLTTTAAPKTHARAFGRVSSSSSASVITLPDSPPPTPPAHKARHEPHKHDHVVLESASATEGEGDQRMRKEFARADDLFRSMSAPIEEGRDGKKRKTYCSKCRQVVPRERDQEGRKIRSAPAKMMRPVPGYESEEEEEEKVRQKEKKRERNSTVEEKDPRALLEQALKKCEADFDTHKRIYLELSDSYRAMNSRADSEKRKILAAHLKESIDTLEHKAEQVKRLHDLLHATPSPAPFGAGRMREGII